MRNAFNKRDLESDARLHRATVLAELLDYCRTLFTNDDEAAEVVNATFLNAAESSLLGCDELSGKCLADLH